MPDKPASPPDPFTAVQTNCVAIMEMLHNFRRAGGGLIESAVLVAAQLAVNAAGGEARSDSDQA